MKEQEYFNYKNGKLDVCEEWDKGRYSVAAAEEKLLNLDRGKKVGDLFKGMTVCPIGNASCHDYLEVEVFGFHPDGSKRFRRCLCTLGIEGDGDKCPLNK